MSDYVLPKLLDALNQLFHLSISLNLVISQIYATSIRTLKQINIFSRICHFLPLRIDFEFSTENEKETGEIDVSRMLPNEERADDSAA